MKKLITITQILMPILIGCAMGSCISGNSDSSNAFFILLILDIAIGISLQVALEAKENNKKEQAREKIKDFILFSALAEVLKENNDEEKKQSNNIIPQKSYLDKDDLFDDEDEDDLSDDEDEDDEDDLFDEDDEEELRDEDNEEDEYNEEYEKFYGLDVSDNLKWLRDKFYQVYSNLVSNGSRATKNIYEDEAGDFLICMCNEMQHSPSKFSFMNISAVSACIFKDNTAIAFSFNFGGNRLGELLRIYIVHTKHDRLRFITIEKSFPFALCEYSSAKHYLHGQIEPNTVHQKINELLENE